MHFPQRNNAQDESKSFFFVLSSGYTILQVTQEDQGSLLLTFIDKTTFKRTLVVHQCCLQTDDLPAQLQLASQSQSQYIQHIVELFSNHQTDDWVQITSNIDSVTILLPNSQNLSGSTENIQTAQVNLTLSPKHLSQRQALQLLDEYYQYNENKYKSQILSLKGELYQAMCKTDHCAQMAKSRLATIKQYKKQLKQMQKKLQNAQQNEKRLQEVLLSKFQNNQKAHKCNNSSCCYLKLCKNNKKQELHQNISLENHQFQQENIQQKKNSCCNKRSSCNHSIDSSLLQYRVKVKQSKKLIERRQRENIYRTFSFSGHELRGSTQDSDGDQPQHYQEDPFFDPADDCDGFLKKMSILVRRSAFCCCGGESSKSMVCFKHANKLINQ